MEKGHLNNSKHIHGRWIVLNSEKHLVYPENFYKIKGNIISGKQLIADNDFYDRKIWYMLKAKKIYHGFH